MPLFFSSSKTENLGGHTKIFHKPRTNHSSVDYQLPIESSSSGIYYFNTWLKLHLSKLSKERWTKWGTTTAT